MNFALMNDFLFSSVNDKTDYDVIQENHRYIHYFPINLFVIIFVF